MKRGAQGVRAPVGPRRRWLWLVPLLHLVITGGYALLRRPVGDFTVETDFFGDYVPWSREWMFGRPSVMNGFKGPVYYLLLGTLSRLGSLFTGFSFPPPPGLEFGIGKLLAVLSAALSLYLTGRLAMRLLHGGQHAANTKPTSTTLLLIVASQALLATTLAFIDQSFRAGTDMVALALYLLAFDRAFAATSPRGMALAWAIAGLSVLTRGSNVGLLPVLIVIALGSGADRRDRLTRLAFGAGGYLLVSLPWWIFLASRTGDPFYNRNVVNAAYEVFAKRIPVPVDAFMAAKLPFDSSLDLFRADAPRVIWTWIANLVRHRWVDAKQVIGWPFFTLLLLGHLLLATRGRERVCHRRVLLLFVSECLTNVPIFYGERFALPLLPLYAVGLVGYPALGTFAFGAPGRSLHRFWSVAGTRLGWTAAVTVLALGYFRGLAASENPDRFYQPRELLRLRDDLARRSVALDPDGVIAARKPHVAYWLGLRSTGVPLGNTLDELLERLRAAGVRYLYAGSSEMQLRPVLAPLASPLPNAPVPPGLRRVGAAVHVLGSRVYPAILWELIGVSSKPPEPLHSTLTRHPSPPGVPRGAFLQGELGAFYLRQGAIEQAGPYLERALAAAPDWKAQRLLLGDVYYLRDRMDNAIEQYLRVAESWPDTVSVHARLATALVGRGDREGAGNALARALELAGYTDASDAAALGEKLFRRELYVAAIAPLHYAQSSDPRDWRSRQYLGLLALRVAKNVAEAKKLLRECLELAPPGADRDRVRLLLRDLESEGSSGSRGVPLEFLDESN